MFVFCVLVCGVLHSIFVCINQHSHILVIHSSPPFFFFFYSSFLQCVFAYVSKDYVYKTQQELAQFEDTATAEALADEGEFIVFIELIILKCMDCIIYCF